MNIRQATDAVLSHNRIEPSLA